MPTTAPSPNCGFTTTGPAGWVRLRLANDEPSASWRDLWTLPGRFYPLVVAAYELDNTVAHPDSLVFDERDDLGGYTRSKGLDEAPYETLDDNVGVFACGDGTFNITTANDTAHVVTIAAGDFYAGNVAAIGEDAPYLFLVAT